MDKGQEAREVLADDDYVGILIRAAEQEEVAAAANRAALTQGLTDDASLAEWNEKKASAFRAVAEALASHAPAIGGPVEQDRADLDELLTAWRQSIGNPVSWLPKLRARLAPPIPEAARVEEDDDFADLLRAAERGEGVYTYPVTALPWLLRDQVISVLMCEAEPHVVADAIGIARQAAAALDASTPPSEASHGGETASGEVEAEARGPGDLWRIECGGANSHLFEDRLYFGSLCIGFVAEEWSTPLLVALASSGDSVDGQGEGR